MKRARDFVLYISIGFVVAITAIALAYSPVDIEVLMRWGGFLGCTMIVFGYFIADSKNFFRVHRFWTLTGVLLLAHLIVFGIVLTHLRMWRFAWFSGTILELPAFLFLRSRFLE